MQLWYSLVSLNTDFVTYNGCVQAVKKHIKGLEITVQSNKSLNMKKSLTIIGSVQKGTTFYKIKKIQEVKLKRFQIRLVHRILATNVTLKKKLKNNKKQITRYVPFAMHTQKIFLICFAVAILYSTFG